MCKWICLLHLRLAFRPFLITPTLSLHPSTCILPLTYCCIMFTDTYKIHAISKLLHLAWHVNSISHKLSIILQFLLLTTLQPKKKKTSKPYPSVHTIWHTALAKYTITSYMEFQTTTTQNGYYWNHPGGIHNTQVS